MVSGIERLKEGFSQLKLPVKNNTYKLLLRYYELIIKWNKKINIVSRQEENIIERHILDSLSIYDLLKGDHLLDFGTGAGFPGIPLKILKDDIFLDLVESRKKKAVFLRELMRELGLCNVRIYNVDIIQHKPEMCYDIITARKVGSIKKIVKLTARLLEENGRIIMFKGEKLPKEIEDARNVLKRNCLSITERHKRIFTKGEIVVIGRANG